MDECLNPSGLILEPFGTGYGLTSRSRRYRVATPKTPGMRRWPDRRWNDGQAPTALCRGRHGQTRESAALLPPHGAAQDPASRPARLRRVHGCLQGGTIRDRWWPPAIPADGKRIIWLSVSHLLRQRYLQSAGP